MMVETEGELDFHIGKGIVVHEGADVTVIACGLMVQAAMEAAEALANKGIDVEVIDMHTVKPLDEELVRTSVRKAGRVVTAEDHSVIDGLGDAVLAVPHAKSDSIRTPGVVVLKLTQAVEWPSFDDVPVDVALALYVPAGEAGTTHLKLLSKSAVMLMDEGFRNKVRASDDPAEIAELINGGLE